MRVLLLGAGGREHALAWKLVQSPRCAALWIAPGNPGTAALGQNVDLAADDAAGIVGLATREAIDLVVVGPATPLIGGLAEICEAVDLPIFGPSSGAAQRVGIPGFARQLMLEAGVPTPAAQRFPDPQAASAIEELSHGSEVALLAFCDGERALPLLPVQDFKRPGATDPTTAGMGALAPAALGSAGPAERLVDLVFTPILQALAARGTPYRGLLSARLLLTSAGPQVLEYTVGFGDPETQVLLPLLESDLLELAWRCATGDLQQLALQWSQSAAVCVVLAAQGYPASPRLGDPILGLESLPADILAFHSATAHDSAGRLVTAGGRVCSLTALAPTLAEARQRVYAAVEAVEFAGKHVASALRES